MEECVGWQSVFQCSGHHCVEVKHFFTGRQIKIVNETKSIIDFLDHSP